MEACAGWHSQMLSDSQIAMQSDAVRSHGEGGQSARDHGSLSFLPWVSNRVGQPVSLEAAPGTAESRRPAPVSRCGSGIGALLALERCRNRGKQTVNW